MDQQLRLVLKTLTMMMMMIQQERPYMRQTRGIECSELRTLTTLNWIFISLSKRSSSSYATHACLSSSFSKNRNSPTVPRNYDGLQSNSGVIGKTT